MDDDRGTPISGNLQLVKSTKFWPMLICWCRCSSDCIWLYINGWHDSGFWFYLGFLLTNRERRIVREVMPISEDTYSAKHRPLAGFGCVLFHHVWLACHFVGLDALTHHPAVSFPKLVWNRWHRLKLPCSNSSTCTNLSSEIGGIN